MKRNVLLKRNYIMFTALLIVIIGLIPVVEDSGNYFLRLDSIEIKAIVLNQVKGLLDTSTPVPEQPGEFAWQANLMPTSNTWGLFNPRQTPPVWERVLLTKQVFTMVGFFCATMVIALFFVFYQTARTGVEEAHLIDN